MIDPAVAIMTWLQSAPAITALVDPGNICTPVLPEGFSALAESATPGTINRAVVIRKATGGKSQPEIPPILQPRFAIECWALESTDAQQVYGVVRDLMHGANSVDLGTAGFIISSQEEVPGEDVADPESHGFFVVAYFNVMMRGPASGAGSDTTLVLGPGVSGGPLTRYSNTASPPTITPTANPNVWMLSVTFSANALVFLNGDLLSQDGDYTTSGNQITFAVVPGGGDNITVLQ